MSNLVNRRMNLTQQAAETLGNAIVSGRYDDLNPVPSEAIICEQLQVSRSAAREAVKSLAAKGLISSRARQGIRVLPEAEWNLFDSDVLRWIRDTNPSLELLREFAEIRACIEPEAAYLAAERQNPQLISEIGNALNRMAKATKSLDDPLEADIGFHVSILNASENRFFKQLSRIIDTTLRVNTRFSLMKTEINSASYDHHQKIYEAIVSQNSEQARLQSRNLMTETLNTVVNALEENAK